MRMTAITALLIMLAVASADISIVGYEVIPESLTPGVRGALSVTITNPDVGDATGVTLSAPGNDNIRSGITRDLGDFKSGITTTVTIPFTIKDTLETGVYSFRVDFYWFTDEGARTKTLNIPMLVSDLAVFQIDIPTTTVYTDDDFSVEGTLANAGGMAYDVKMHVSSDLFFGTGPTPLLLGDIKNSTSFTLPLTIGPGVSSGKYSIPLLITYRDKLGVDRNATISMSVNVIRRSPDFIIGVDGDKPFTPGERVNVKIKIENIGDGDAYSLRLSMGNNTAFTPLSSSDVYINRLDAGEEKEVSMDVGVNDVPPGFYSVDFSIEYKNKNGEEQTPEKVSAGVNVEAKNELSIFVSSSPVPIVSGNIHTLTITISNIGSSPIKALTVRMKSDFMKILEAQERQFIGELEADDFSSVQYKVLVSDVEEGDHSFFVETTFKDAYNVEHVEEHTTVIEVVSMETAAAGKEEGDNTLLLAGGVILIAIVAIFLLRKRKKK